MNTKEIESRIKKKRDTEKDISARCYNQALTNYNQSAFANTVMSGSPDHKSQISKTQNSGFWGSGLRAHHGASKSLIQQHFWDFDKCENEL